ncbi:MAG: transglutaminase-like domain-containing protein [Actinomycetota bacterium]
MYSYADEFRALVDRPDDEIDLAAAALTIAAAAEPGLDIGYWQECLNEFAFGIDDLESLRKRLFTELGFAGDTEDYYDPQNSFLNRTIRRRKGIPITLSVLTMEVGRRAGIKLEGVGMPGHFLVRVAMTGEHIDPFFGGTLLDEAGCEQRFRQISGGDSQVPFGPEMLQVVNKKQILARMLNNLKAVYRARSDGSNLEWVVRMSMAIPEVGPMEVVELGHALAMQGQFLQGAELIDQVADKHPSVAEQLRLAALSIRASLN